MVRGIVNDFKCPSSSPFSICTPQVHFFLLFPARYTYIGVNTQELTTRLSLPYIFEPDIVDL